MVDDFGHGDHELRLYPAGKCPECKRSHAIFHPSHGPKNPNGILAAFSQQTPWKYQPYEIGTGRPLKAVVINPKQMANDFQTKRGWYNFFLADPNGYTFRLNFMRHLPWKKRGANTFVAPESDSGNTYIRWRLEGQTWVIAVIGETTP